MIYIFLSFYVIASSPILTGVVVFHINKSQIINEICEGRFFVKNECQGKCFIKKQAEAPTGEVVIHFENELSQFIDTDEAFQMVGNYSYIGLLATTYLYKSILLEVDTPPPRFS